MLSRWPKSRSRRCCKQAVPLKFHAGGTARKSEEDEKGRGRGMVGTRHKLDGARHHRAEQAGIHPSDMGKEPPLTEGGSEWRTSKVTNLLLVRQGSDENLRSQMEKDIWYQSSWSRGPKIILVCRMVGRRLSRKGTFLAAPKRNCAGEGLPTQRRRRRGAKPLLGK